METPMTFTKKISDTLTPTGKIKIINKEAISVLIKNTGTQALIDFRLRVYVSDEDNEGMTIARTNADFGPIPPFESAIQYIEQEDISDNAETVAPLTLPAGSTLLIGLATETSYVKSLDSIELFAQVALGQNTTLQFNVSRG